MKPSTIIWNNLVLYLTFFHLTDTVIKLNHNLKFKQEHGDVLQTIELSNILWIQTILIFIFMLATCLITARLFLLQEHQYMLNKYDYVKEFT